MPQYNTKVMFDDMTMLSMFYPCGKDYDLILLCRNKVCFAMLQIKDVYHMEKVNIFDFQMLLRLQDIYYVQKNVLA